MENWRMEHKIVTHINYPKEWESENDWDSHRPLLWLSLINTKGRGFEFGCGAGSTTLMREHYEKSGREFFSFETNKEYAEKYESQVVDSYIFENVGAGRTMFDDKLKSGVIFVDAAPAEIRKDIIHQWANLCDVIVVHDTEIGAEYVYGLSVVLSTFKYRLDYQPKGKPHTTAVSNFIDVTKFV